jgi:hypothetical protein
MRSLYLVESDDPIERDHRRRAAHTPTEEASVLVTA